MTDRVTERITVRMNDRVIVFVTDRVAVRATGCVTARGADRNGGARPQASGARREGGHFEGPTAVIPPAPPPPTPSLTPFSRS